MTTIITRLYATRAAADAAAARLPKIPLARSAFDVFSGGTETSAIRAAGVYADAAATYAEKLTDGCALIVARAPFGTAKQAMAVLDEQGPLPAAVRYPDVYVESSSSWVYETKNLPELVDYTLMSGGLMPPALSREPYPFSSFFGVPMLTSDRWPRTELLTHNPTPFSSLFGLPTLSRNQEPRSHLVKGSTTPFSSLLGLPLLTRDPDRTFLTE